MEAENLKLMEEVILVIGNVGGDGGYSVLTPHGIVKVPGNNPLAREAYAALAKSYLAFQRLATKREEAPWPQNTPSEGTLG